MSEHIQQSLAAEKLTRSVKIGRSSFMLGESTHRGLAELAAELQCSLPAAIRFTLLNTVPILVQIQRQVGRRFAEIYGWDQEPPELTEARAAFCLATGMDEVTARIITQAKGLEHFHKSRLVEFDDEREGRKVQVGR